MAQQQPSSNRSRLPDRHRFPFLRDLAHPHWNGINGIATIIGVFVAIIGIVVGIIVAQGQGAKLPSSNGQPGIASPGYSMTATRQAASSATSTATDTPTTQPSLPNIVGSYSGAHTFSGTGEPHQPMSLTITQQHGQSFSGTCMLQRNYQIENGSVENAGDVHFTVTAIRDEGGTTIVTFVGVEQPGGGWQGTFTDTVGDTGTWNVVKTS